MAGVGNASNLTNAGKGRPKGSVNKSTATMKAAIQSVYDKLQADHGKEKPGDGPHGHFATWAKDNETEFYKLASKLLPIQIGSDPDNPMPTGFVVSLVKAPDEA